MPRWSADTANLCNPSDCQDNVIHEPSERREQPSTVDRRGAGGFDLAGADVRECKVGVFRRKVLL